MDCLACAPKCYKSRWVEIKITCIGESERADCEKVKKKVKITISVMQSVETERIGGWIGWRAH